MSTSWPATPMPTVMVRSTVGWGPSRRLASTTPASVAVAQGLAGGSGSGGTLTWPTRRALIDTSAAAARTAALPSVGSTWTTTWVVSSRSRSWRRVRSAAANAHTRSSRRSTARRVAPARPGGPAAGASRSGRNTDDSLSGRSGRNGVPAAGAARVDAAGVESGPQPQPEPGDHDRHRALVAQRRVPPVGGAEEGDAGVAVDAGDVALVGAQGQGQLDLAPLGDLHPRAWGPAGPL